jgi:hypothetical protein
MYNARKFQNSMCVKDTVTQTLSLHLSVPSLSTSTRGLLKGSKMREGVLWTMHDVDWTGTFHSVGENCWLLQISALFHTHEPR